MAMPSSTTDKFPPPLDDRNAKPDERGLEKQRSQGETIASRRIRSRKFPLRNSPTATTLTSSATRNDNGIETLRYEETSAADPPIPVIKSPPRQPPTDIHPALRRAKSTGTASAEEWKRDSGLAPTTSSKGKENNESFVDSAIEEQEEDGLGRKLTIEERERALGIKIDFDHQAKLPLQDLSLMASPSTTRLNTESKSSAASSLRWRRKKKAVKVQEDENYSIDTEIPTDNLIDEAALDSIEFSKRGSLMLLGQKAVNCSRRQPSFSMLMMPKAKMLPEDVEKESQKVRSMYEQGSEYKWENGGRYSNPDVLGQSRKNSTTSTEQSGMLQPTIYTPTSDVRPDSTLSVRNEHELAGGVEDWEDIESTEVDRYGFIDSSRRGRGSRPGSPEPRRMQRVSTMLQMASDAPRQKRTLGRNMSSSASFAVSQKKAGSRKVSTKSVKTQGSTASSRSTSGSRLRAVSNRFPGNKDRRWMDEAGDMLTLPPGLADIAEDEEGGHAATALKMREWERGQKWFKMAKIKNGAPVGEGMSYEFDVKNPKLIERTWKGIPDRWRASAWYSFLATSAKKREDSVPDWQIVQTFHKLMDQSSADDVQIDLDVPRTINSHIMFRRRYRGGQRLLFRVLHALSLYFPETGYVQGMASLAATLLCYYDEEKTFVMLVRLWTLRGLDTLYESGFPGLMAALDEFKTKWIANSAVAVKLEDLAIDPTAYGTRWYLTLFNYSIPFAAQLRVWDVFMLLGDVDPSIPATKERPFQGCLDVLHAVSAALIDGTREILLDSDFENAMKVLTSWIPVKDEELLMKVTRAEWKLQRKGRKS